MPTYECCSRFLSLNKRQQTHNSGALNGPSQHPLMFGADTSVLWVNNFPLAGDKPLQKLNFFIIDVLRILRTKKALHANVIKIYEPNAK
jgi:hypothetical protein